MLLRRPEKRGRSRRDALHVPLGKRRVHHLLAARAAFERRRTEVPVAHLWNAQIEFSQAGAHRLGLEAIGLVAALGGAFVRSGLQEIFASKEHRRI